MTSTTPAAHDHHHARPGHGPAPESDREFAELLDLDAVHAAPFLREALLAAAAALGREPREIVDLGAGTGTSTVALANHFPEARVHALDASPGMLERLRASSIDTGVSSRVETHLLNLDDNWPSVLPGSVDLAWAALSLHHTNDPARVLQQTFALLRPGGVAVVSEFTGATTYSPADLGTGRQSLADHLVKALAARGYPVAPDWSEALTEAGFARIQRQETTISVSSATLDGARFLQLQLTLNRQLLANDLGSEDLVAVDAAIVSLASDRPAVAHKYYTSGRVFWVAVRPDGRGADTAATGVDR
ncbi:class I SAM-dependent methyltransferase [Frondihabitans cladoniiphilus]|uniref:class I SAM-dependent methyltransferase n=1 Tax=Frondihabitans cladoniiphilus TaxID=715785 RepID=UPI0031E96B31